MSTRREMVNTTIVTVFAVTEERFDDQHYPYQHVVSMWSDHLQAFDSMSDHMKASKRYRIMTKSLDTLDNGRVIFPNIRSIWENGKWVDEEYDPRANDPMFKEYLRLKEIYGEG